MNHRHLGKRRPGRPLTGAEALDSRLTVMVSTSMLSQIESRAAGRVPEFVRRVLGRALSGGKVSKKSRPSGRGKRVRRYGQKQ